MGESLEFLDSPWAKVAAIVAGAGAGAAVASQVRQFAPSLTDEVAGAGAGLVCYIWGGRAHPLVRYLGIGLIAGSLMPRVAEWFKGVAAPTAAAPTRAPVTPRVKKATAASTSAALYLASKKLIKR